MAGPVVPSIKDVVRDGMRVVADLYFQGKLNEAEESYSGSDGVTWYAAWAGLKTRTIDEVLSSQCPYMSTFLSGIIRPVCKCKEPCAFASDGITLIRRKPPCEEADLVDYIIEVATGSPVEVPEPPEKADELERIPMSEESVVA